MEVAVFIDCDRLLISERDYCLRFIFEIYTDSAILSLNIDK